jgi:hypothetical protein
MSGQQTSSLSCKLLLMDFEVSPLPPETEFRVHSVKQRLYQLTREELEDFLIQSLTLMTKLTHQTRQMKKQLERRNG